MICNIKEEITGNKADLEHSETSIEVFIEVKLIVSTNSTVFQPLSF